MQLDDAFCAAFVAACGLIQSRKQTANLLHHQRRYFADEMQQALS